MYDQYVRINNSQIVWYIFIIFLSEINYIVFMNTLQYF